MPYTPPLIQTSAQLAAQLSDETGSGLAVFGTGPTITLANGSGLPVSGITSSTSTALGVGSIELGAASDTTIARSGAGAITVEGTQVILSGAALGTPASGTLTNCSSLPVSGITASTSTALGVGSIELGHASDTTIARVSSGVISVEGVTVDTISAANTLTNKTLTSPTLTTPVLGTPSSGTLTSCTGTADGLTAGDVTRNHAVYAAASPPTVDVGEFTIVKTGVDLKTAATTTVFTVPTSRTFICSYAAAFVTSVTTGGAGTQTFKIQEGGGTAMTPATVSGSGTPVANSSYYQQPGTAGGGLYKAAAAGVTVQVVIATSHAGSTAVSGSIFVTGKYVT